MLCSPCLPITPMPTRRPFRTTTPPSSLSLLGSPRRWKGVGGTGGGGDVELDGLGGGPGSAAASALASGGGIGVAEDARTVEASLVACLPPGPPACAGRCWPGFAASPPSP